MRKTLVALAVVTSVVLLQAPAWAPNIYIVQDGNQRRAANQSYNTANVTATSDICKGKQLTVTFKWGEKLEGTTSADGTLSGSLKRIPRSNGKVKTANVKNATCDGEELPFTGVASAPMLALGVSLLVIGALLVLSSRRRPIMRRG
jgi:hypothetical protein